MSLAGISDTSPGNLGSPVSTTTCLDLRESGLCVLVVDSHALVRVGLTYILQSLSRPIEVVEAGTYAQAIEALEQQRFGLVVLDVRLPGATSRETLLNSILHKADGAPVVVLSMMKEPDEIKAVIEAGAAGIIPKTARPEVVLKVINLVMSGRVN